MGKVLIKNYRGFEIEFNDIYEKFQCVITDDLVKESLSFSAIKKFIDDYLKDNQNFSPFMVQYGFNKSEYGASIKGLIVGIRKDGLFVLEKNGKKMKISKYDEKYIYLSDSMDKDLLDELEKVSSEKVKVCKEYEDKIQSIKEQIAPVSLIDFRENMKL